MSDLEQAQASEATAPEDKTEVQATAPKKRLLIIMMICVLLSALFGGVTAWVLGPQLKNQQWLARLHALPTSTTAAVPAVANSALVTYKTKTVTQGTSPKQYALSLDGKKPSAPALIFGDPSQGKKMEVFLDPAGPRSADFILMNKSTLANLVTTKKIYLVVYLTPTANAYSLYATEALYETATADPEKTWQLLGELLRARATVSSNQSQDMLKAVHTTVAKAGVAAVSETTIKAGSFFSWALTASQDPKTSVGYALPVLYVDGKLIDSRKTNINDYETLRKVVLEG